MNDQPPTGLSRRERQILDAVYTAGRATAAEVRAGLPDPPSDSAVRTLLRIMERKGHLTHTAVDGRYLYAPVRRRPQAGRGALRRLLRTFFDNSAAKAMAALLDGSVADLSPAELDEIAALVDQAKQRNGEP